MTGFAVKVKVKLDKLTSGQADIVLGTGPHVKKEQIPVLLIRLTMCLVMVLFISGHASLARNVTLVKEAQIPVLLIRLTMCQVLVLFIAGHASLARNVTLVKGANSYPRDQTDSVVEVYWSCLFQAMLGKEYYPCERV